MRITHNMASLIFIDIVKKKQKKIITSSDQYLHKRAPTSHWNKSLNTKQTMAYIRGTRRFKSRSWLKTDVQIIVIMKTV